MGTFSEQEVAEFRARLGRFLEALGCAERDIVELPTGCVCAPASRLPGAALRPLGCPFCLGEPLAADAGGYPALRGEALLPFTHAHEAGALPPEVEANLWLCPRCLVPVRGTLPEFLEREDHVGI